MKNLFHILLIIPFLTFSQNTNCGERPLKPEKAINQTQKAYKGSTKYLNYKQVLKEWKYCMSPRAMSEEVEEKFNEIYDCGDKPKKPNKGEGQTTKEYKNSAEYLNYKQALKEWQYCISPLGMSEKDEERFKENSEISIDKFLEKIENPCGKRPEKPARAKGQTHDEYRKTAKYVNYKKTLKEWKRCNGPQGISKRNQETMNKDFEKIKEEKMRICGKKPTKPARAKGLNHEEYRQTPEHIKYREDLKIWKECSRAIDEKYKNK